MYQSFFEDWVEPNSILGVIVVVHSNVGEASRNGRVEWPASSTYDVELDHPLGFQQLR